MPAGTALGQQLPADVRERCDIAAAFGMTHNRLRDWYDGNHSGYALGAWLRDYKEQVFLFTQPSPTASPHLTQPRCHHRKARLPPLPATA